MKKAVCGMCQGGCRVLLETENGRITKLLPDTEDAAGRLCLRGALAPEMLYGEQRIKTPLIRTGERGQGTFREATWEEAYAHASDLIKKTADTYGPQSLVSYFGRGVLGTPVFQFGAAAARPSLFARLGSPNDTTCSSICNLSISTIVPFLTMGFHKRFLYADIEHSDYILFWGKNPMTDEGPQMLRKRILKAKERGVKVIVIDPRGGVYDSIADEWYGVTPGSDGALALCMMKQIIEEDRYDHAFTNHFVKGFEEFKEYLDSLKYDDLSEQCGLSLSDIRHLTDLFCSTPKISMVLFTGLEYQMSGVQNGRAIFTLFAITGKLDVEGGMYLDGQGLSVPKTYEKPKGILPLGFEEYPLFHRHGGTAQFIGFQRAVLEDKPYPVRGLFLTGGSPLLSFPGSERMREAYKKLDCLLVADRFFTEDALYADVVFPACSLFECPSVVENENGTWEIAEPPVPPIGEARNDVLIVTGLMEALGVRLPDEPLTEEELRRWLPDHRPPFSFGGRKEKSSEKRFIFKKYETGQLRADGKPGFPTPSGKYEIYSTVLEEYGYSPLPKYDDVRSIEGFDKDTYPFMLTTGARSSNRMGVLGANIPKIAAAEPSPLAEIDPADADAFGIADGDPVRITTPFGSAVFKAKRSRMAGRSIHVPHGGGGSAMTPEWKEGNANKLTSPDLCDPLSGFAMLKSIPCRIEKA